MPIHKKVHSRQFIVKRVESKNTVYRLPSTVNKRLWRFGFTLIELLIVITVIGILATFIIASFTTATQKARDAKRKSDLNAVGKALELARADCSYGAYYPSLIGGGNYDHWDMPSASGPAESLKLYLETLGYIKTIPQDPKFNVSLPAIDPPTDTNSLFYWHYAYYDEGPGVIGGCANAGGTRGNYEYIIRARLERGSNDPNSEPSRIKCSSNSNASNAKADVPGSPSEGYFYYVCND